jgi:large subunit ribosomal protein L2
MGKRILSRRRGAAPPRMISPSHLHHGDVKYPVNWTGTATVESIAHAVGRTCIFATLKTADGKELLHIANEGMSVGQQVVFTNTTQILPGNVTIVSKIPEGTPIYNIEARPNDGGKFVKTAGTAAEVVTHAESGKTIVRMPSGKFREFHPLARATIGLVAGGGRGDKPFMKAGKKFHALRAKGVRWPRVRGVAMNPVDHPHGGGSHNFKGAPTSQARGTPPGAKVGKIAPKRTGMRR